MNTEQAQNTNIADGVQVAEISTEQYLTFMLGTEEYGVDILRVQEIKGWDSATQIPNTPDYILGVINLRGTIVPIIDMRSRFNMERIEYDKTTVVIVLKVYSRNDDDKKERTMGFVVDAVSDVYDVPLNELKPPPDFGSIVKTEFIRGLATIDKKMIILLDIDHLVDADSVVSHTETDAEQVALAETTH